MITWGKLTFQHAKSIKWNKEGHFVFSKKYTQFWDLMVIKIYLSDNRIKIYTVKNCIVLLVVVVLVAQSCPTLCDPIDGSPPGSPLPGILQARTLEWLAISFSNAWKWKVKVKSLCHVWPSATPWTAAFQAPPSMGFSRQEYWSWVPLPSPFLRLCATKLKAIQTKIWR